MGAFRWDRTAAGSEDGAEGQLVASVWIGDRNTTPKSHCVSSAISSLVRWASACSPASSPLYGPRWPRAQGAVFSQGRPQSRRAKGRGGTHVPHQTLKNVPKSPVCSYRCAPRRERVQARTLSKTSVSIIREIARRLTSLTFCTISPSPSHQTTDVHVLSI